MFETAALTQSYDVLAPDGSEIRLLSTLTGGSMVHCRLPAGATSLAVTHRTVEELWYCLAGEGQVWRSLDGHEAVVDVAPGCALTIPLGAHFQFRNTGSDPFDLVIVTMPPWPGDDEAVRVADHWPVDPP